MTGAFIWITAEYSVPEAQLCRKRAKPPKGDHICVKPPGHDGAHACRKVFDTRPYSHLDTDARRAAVEGGGS